jgi:hypothetical protein
MSCSKDHPTLEAKVKKKKKKQINQKTIENKTNNNSKNEHQILKKNFKN